MVLTDCTWKNFEALAELELSGVAEALPEGEALDAELSGVVLDDDALDCVMLPSTRTSSPTCFASFAVSPCNM